MPSRFPVRLVLGAALLLCGCGDRPSPQGNSGAADAPVVENTAPHHGEGAAWTVSRAPLLSIGGDEGEGSYTLTGVAGAVRLTDGRVVVADKGSQVLHVFDAQGTHLRSIGREGGGPGEFRAVENVALLRGDSIAVWDPRLRRVSVFDGTGQLAREVSPAGLGLFPRFIGVLDDGSFVLTAGLPSAGVSSASTAARRDSVVYLRFGPAGVEARDTIGRFPGPEMVTLASSGAMTMEEVIFGRDFHLVVGGDRYFGADDDRYEVTEYRLTGDPVRRIRRAHAPRQVTNADLASYREQPRDLSGVPPQLRAQFAKRNPDIPHRGTLPAFESLLPDEDGYLWIEHPRVTRAAEGRWDVFDREGQWLTTVATPAGLQVRQIGRDFMLGTALDSLDVEHVHLYTLNRPR